MAAVPILSPMARTQGVAASENLLARLRILGLDDEMIATASAKYHDGIPPRRFAPEAQGLPIGSVGIPTTGIPGIAGSFGEAGVIYVLRVPKSVAVRPIPWQGLELEDEWTIFNKVPPGGIVKVIPANQIAPLRVDDRGLLTLGR